MIWIGLIVYKSGLVHHLTNSTFVGNDTEALEQIIKQEVGCRHTVFDCNNPVNFVYYKMLLNENESYLVLVARQILFVMINNVY